MLQDMELIAQNPQIPWEELKNKQVFVTGATGLIGCAVVKALLHRGDIPVTALVRSAEKAKAMFPEGGVTFVTGSVESLPQISTPVDYIIHCACPTDSSFFVEHPADTAETILAGTKNILNLALQHSAGVVFLSSMEVYGKIEQELDLTEDILGEIDLMSPRSCYPMAKRMAENLCCCYAAQYGVRVMICRLSQTFGPGVKAEDKRVFAYMARCALAGEDIKLATSGSKKNMYLYTADAVTAILTVLLKGTTATVYNAANDATYCSVKEMAEAVAEAFGGGKVSVKTNTDAAQQGKYPPDTFLKLDTTKLRALGWEPKVDLMEMYQRMISAF